MVEIDQKTSIKYYFERSFSYEEITHLTAMHHKHKIKLQHTFEAIEDMDLVE